MRGGEGFHHFLYKIRGGWVVGGVIFVGRSASCAKLFKDPKSNFFLFFLLLINLAHAAGPQTILTVTLKWAKQFFI